MHDDGKRNWLLPIAISLSVVVWAIIIGVAVFLLP
jgi:hypothetical protein